MYGQQGLMVVLMAAPCSDAIGMLLLVYRKRWLSTRHILGQLLQLPGPEVGEVGRGAV